MPRIYWTPEEDALLIELVKLNRVCYPEMVKHFNGRSRASLQKRALRLGLSRDGFVYRKHYYNQAFFEIPNPINCYVAGFYAADGCIGDNPTTRYLSISLAMKDGHQVDTFARLIGYTGQVATDPKEYWGPDHSDMRSLRLYGAQQITADLERVFGLTPAKTFRIPAPNLEDPHLKLCYLAGLLDGDGCVHISIHGYISIKYASSSKTIVEWVKTYTDSLKLKGIRTYNTGPSISSTHNERAYIYAICGAKAIDLIERVQKLKLEGVPILDRKWDNPQINNYIQQFKEKHNINTPPLGV